MEALILLVGVSFVALAGAGVFGREVEAKYECLAGGVGSLSGGSCGSGGGGAVQGLDLPMEPESSDTLPEMPEMRAWNPASMRAWNATEEELAQARAWTPDPPPHPTDRFRPIDDTLTAFSGSYGDGVLKAGEAFLRLPEAIRRGHSGAGELPYLLWRKTGLDVHRSPYPSATRAVINFIADLSNQGADALAGLRERQSHHAAWLATQKQAMLGEAVRGVFQGNLQPAGDAVRDPAFWGAIAGKAIPITVIHNSGIPIITTWAVGDLTRETDASSPIHYGVGMSATIATSVALELLIRKAGFTVPDQTKVAIVRAVKFGLLDTIIGKTVESTQDSEIDSDE